MLTYGALGPRGEMRDPAFVRSLALAALARRRGPPGVSRPPGEFDDISNPVARERYARSFLDEKLRGMIAEREGSQTGAQLARRGMDLQAELGRGQLDLGRGSLEEQIRAEMADEGLKRQRLGLDTQLGADRRLGMEREFGLGTRAADLGEKSLEEQIRANIAGEGLRSREVGVMESTGGYKDPVKKAEADALTQQAEAQRRATLSSWAMQPHVQRRLGQILKSKDVKSLVEFFRNEAPISGVTPSDVRMVMNDMLGQFSSFYAGLPDDRGAGDAQALDRLIEQIRRETAAMEAR